MSSGKFRPENHEKSGKLIQHPKKKPMLIVFTPKAALCVLSYQHEKPAPEKLTIGDENGASQQRAEYYLEYCLKEGNISSDWVLFYTHIFNF